MFPLALVFCFVLALWFLLYHVRDSDADGKVDGGEVLCFFFGDDFGLSGPVHGLAVLLRQFCRTVILVRERGGQLCWDMILERKGPGSLPLSGVPDGCQLARVDLELLGLEPGFFRLIRLEGQLVRRMKGFLVG